MDSRSLEKVIRKREKDYIWLERNLQTCIGICASVLLALFLMVSILWIFQRLTVGNCALLFLVAAGVIGITIFKKYRTMHHDFELISNYLEAFENGDYQFRTEELYMKEGLHSQIVEQLERMGMAMEVMKDRMVDEKENTKALITDISHQLKTPLAALRLSDDLLKDEQITREEKSEIMGRSGLELTKLQTLMDSLTNLSRMEAGMIQIKPAVGDIVDTLTKAVSSVYMKAYQKQIEIEMDEAVEKLSIHDREINHDVKWTEEAVINLLDNAIKYSGEHTTVRIQIEAKISYILILITDEGIGIKKEEYGNIFQRFYRIGTNGTKQEGSGVGLYLARCIIEAQGGNIRVKSVYGAGSTFQIMLPKEKYII